MDGKSGGRQRTRADRSDDRAPRRGRVTLRLPHSEDPDPDWVRTFEAAPWLRTLGQELPIIDRTIEWMIPTTSFDAAWESIKEAVALANLAYPMILQRRQAEIERVDAQRESARRTNVDLQHNLDTLD